MKRASMIGRTVIRNRIILPLFLGLLIPAVMAGQDSLVVKGIIKNSSGEGIPNVSVSIENSSRLPVVTDSEGNFEIYPESGDVWLIIDPASGYKDKRVYLNRRDDLTLILTPTDLRSGDDVMLLFAE